ncbi:MAG: hypothetical protein MRZ79_06920 [Bacteroidia bacterium]|nr:hypothetical protein [Bacteroidia bacterium]
MESFVLAWPQDEKWKITHSSVQGDGRTIAFELEPDSSPIEGEKAMQLIRMPKISPKLDEFFSEWWNGFGQQHQQAEIHTINLTLNFPSKSFFINHLSIEEIPFSAVGFMAIGAEIILLHLNLCPSSEVPPSFLDTKLEFFRSLGFVSQSLHDSLVESGLIPPKTLTIQEKNAKIDFEYIPLPIRPYAHPRHPNEFQVWKISFDPLETRIFWARILKEVNRGLFVAVALSGEKDRSLYVVWDEMRRSFVEISAEGLAMADKKASGPCPGCGFNSFDPSIFFHGIPAFNCPFCHTEIR